MRRKEAERVLCLYSSNVHTEEGLLVQLLFGKICCEYKNYVFLVVLKSYFASLRVVTSIIYLIVMLKYIGNVFMKRAFS